MKLAGQTYMQIHQKGGGIAYTVKCTQASSHDELLNLVLARCDRFVKAGTTTIEAKSGKVHFSPLLRIHAISSASFSSFLESVYDRELIGQWPARPEFQF
jgi:hypothetical protein